MSKDQEKNNRFEKWSIGEAAKWLIDNAKEAGINLDGFVHEVTNYFIHHVKKEHGNPDKEKTRGQIAVTEDDFLKISEIINNPDYAMIGVKRNNQNILYYIKRMNDGTTLYVEEVIDKNKSLRSRTMFKRKNDVDREKFINIVSMNKNTDTSKSRIVSPLGTGSNPSYNQSQGSKAAANPVQPQD